MNTQAQIDMSKCKDAFIINEKGVIKPATKTMLEVLCYKPDIANLLAAFQRDTGTRERTLIVQMEYPDHSLSKLMTFAPSKMKGDDPFHALLDLDGVDSATDTLSIYQAYQKRKKDLIVLDIKGERVSAIEAYERLSEYAKQYERKGFCFIKDGHCNFHTTIFQEKIDYLELGWKRLDLEKAFYLMGILRTNGEHPYSYAIKCDEGPTSNPWFISFPVYEKEKGDIVDGRKE